MAKTRKDRPRTQRLLVVGGADTDASTSAARGLMAAKLPFVMLKDAERAREWVRRNRGEFGGLVVAIGDDGEGLDLVRDLRDQEIVRKQVHKPMVAWSAVPLPDAHKVCASSGADAIVLRDNLPDLPQTLSGLKAA